MSRIAVVALVLATTLTTARADRRAFTQTYEYATMPAGQVEMELYTEEARPDLSDDDIRAFQMQLEFEVGITDRWDVSVYHVFEQSIAGAESEALHFSEVKAKTRYRFAERGEWPVDTLLYFEGIKVFAEDVYELELKGIFARDFDKVTVALNLIAEVAFGDVEEFEQGFALGATYEVSPAWKLGAEAFGNGELQEGEFEKMWAGPSLSWAPSPGFWFAINAGFGVLEQSDDLLVRSIFGLHL